MVMCGHGKNGGVVKIGMICACDKNGAWYKWECTWGTVLGEYMVY